MLTNKNWSSFPIPNTVDIDIVTVYGKPPSGEYVCLSRVVETPREGRVYPLEEMYRELEEVRMDNERRQGMERGDARGGRGASQAVPQGS